MKTALTVVFLIVCVLICIIVLAQEAKDNGLGSLAGGAAAGETYWSKNKGRSMEGTLVWLTRVLAAAFIILSVVLNMSFWTK